MESPVLLTVSPVPLIVIYKVILVVSMKKKSHVNYFKKPSNFFRNNEWARLYNIRVVLRPEIQGTVVPTPGLGSHRAGAHEPHPFPRHAHVDG